MDDQATAGVAFIGVSQYGITLPCEHVSISSKSMIKNRAPSKATIEPNMHRPRAGSFLLLKMLPSSSFR